MLIFSVKTLCLSLLNLYCVFNITLLFFTNSWRQSPWILFFLKFFILFSIWAASKQFLLSWNLKVSFYDTLFCAFCFFIFIIVIAFALNQTNSVMNCPPNSSFTSPFYFSFRQWSVNLKNCSVKSCFSIFQNIFANIICFCMNIKAVCIHQGPF